MFGMIERKIHKIQIKDLNMKFICEFYEAKENRETILLVLNETKYYTNIGYEEVSIFSGDLPELLYHFGFLYKGKYVDENALSVTIKRLRDKLEDNSSAPRYIKTVYGIGYTWSDERLGGIQKGTHG